MRTHAWEVTDVDVVDGSVNLRVGPSTFAVRAPSVSIATTRRAMSVTTVRPGSAKRWYSKSPTTTAVSAGAAGASFPMGSRSVPVAMPATPTRMPAAVNATRLTVLRCTLLMTIAVSPFVESGGGDQVEQDATGQHAVCGEADRRGAHDRGAARLPDKLVPDQPRNDESQRLMDETT